MAVTEGYRTPLASGLLLALAVSLLLVAAPSASAAGESAAELCAGPCWVSLGKRGGGTGTVTSEPEGMACGTTCHAPYFHGTWAALVAMPDPGSRFTRWEGECDQPNGTRCTLFMAEGKSIMAVFDLVGAADTPPPSSLPPPPPAPPPSVSGACTITGTSGDDELTGTPRRDVICALGGNDHIHPGAGNDVVFASTGSDEVEAGPGADRVEGGPGNDELFGNGGSDRLTGVRGRDAVTGGLGTDVLILRDGARDVGRGGPGVDRARVDRRDRLAATERRF